jgi:hypothetical protein
MTGVTTEALTRRRDAIVLSLLALLITLCFLDVLLGIKSFYIRDIAYFFHPSKKLLRDIVLGGEFPFWNPFFHAGQPLAANPQHEVFYPLTWLILLPSFEVGFNILVLIHLYILAFATYALLRSMNAGPAAAFFGAWSFGMGGLAISCLNLLPMLFSLAWLPLTLLYARRFLREGKRRDFAMAAFFLGLQLIVGEPTTVMETGILLGIYALSRRPILRRVGTVTLLCTAALCLSAVQTVPATDHFSDTPRARGLDFEVVIQQSTPPERLVELVYPNFFGQVTAENNKPYWGGALYERVRVTFLFSIYSGLLLTVFAIAGIAADPRRAGVLLAVCTVSLLLAFGSHTPLFRVLYDLGLARSTRFPEKFLLMAAFAWVVFGAKSLDRALNGDARIRRAAIGVTAIVTLVAIGAWTVTFLPVYPRLFATAFKTEPILEILSASRRGWLIASARGALLLAILAAMRRLQRPLWLVAAGVFLVADLAPLVPDLAPRFPSSFYREPPAAALKFPANRGDFRIFHYADRMRNSAAGRVYQRPDPDFMWLARNALPPMTPAAYGLRTVMEIDYDVTSLNWSNELTRAAWELAALRPADWLNTIAAMSNIWYAGIYERPETAFAKAHGVTRDVQPVRFIEGHHYPRYYFADAIVSVRDREDFVRRLASGQFPFHTAFVSDSRPIVQLRQPAASVQSWKEWTNGARIEVDASSRAFLVMSVTAHKYWRITIDGREVQPVITNLAYQGVVVPPGRHVVAMDYRNPLIPAGAAISLATLLGLFLATRTKKPRRSAILPAASP